MTYSVALHEAEWTAFFKLELPLKENIDNEVK